ncbi:uncharacterized protein HRG_06197 [Hirsutella rhossiliensis]|uniref:Uncharacterized protein n=1 Tax=Hirsutella rhossiliensis TaxID=111463 RepID=A0A9P8N2U5_9HYPO|nr:uncharacterized protein HRG_06197 [Hirsutella rhossiliensis]KAH0963687.1 hypothetical protein HRG_06197 [Hirsutella rhossiliensis]
MPPSSLHIFGDVFSVLLILGGDVVATALAQLAGSGLAPATFSFGWVAYSVGALMSAVGHNKLMPSSPDCACKVINGQNGFARENSSWIISRVMRDFQVWCDPLVAKKSQDILDDKWQDLKRLDSRTTRPQQAGLVVSVYQPSKQFVHGTVKTDSVHWIGFLTMLAQLGVALIPAYLFGDWGILIITTGGTVLSMATGLLPQWKTEKWACRRKSRATYILTRGNGSQHAIVMLGNGHGFNLEGLASGQSNVQAATKSSTRIALLVLFILWVLLLITAAGLKGHTWFLLAVGGLGIVQNVQVAGCPRRPESFGLCLDFVDVYAHKKAMETLLETERNHEHVGRALVPELFPGDLTAAEVQI